MTARIGRSAARVLEKGRRDAEDVRISGIISTNAPHLENVQLP
jgi:hypothetical protein